MHTFRRSEPHRPPATWPLWTLGAVAPVVAALGIVGGVAAATFLAPPPAGSLPRQEQATARAPGDATGPDSAAAKPGGNAITSPGSTAPGEMSIPPNNSTATLPTPSDIPDRSVGAPRVIRDLRDAQAELDSHYSYYTDGRATINRIEYRVMRNAGLSISLVGMISVQDYAGWARALRENPQRLQDWLEAAAARVLPATEKERIFLAWAVVDVRSNRPSNFSNDEVRTQHNGTHLITRPLASAIDPGQTKVAVRPLSSAPSGPTPTGPWSTYGPQIRGDSTDIYRPTGIYGR